MKHEEETVKGLIGGICGLVAGILILTIGFLEDAAAGGAFSARVVVCRRAAAPQSFYDLLARVKFLGLSPTVISSRVGLAAGGPRFCAAIQIVAFFSSQSMN